MYFRLLISLIIIKLFSFNSSAQCTSCTHNINGNSNSNITVNGTRKFCINSGTFTGNVNGPNGQATLCIGENATFNPQNINNWNGIIYNYGDANVNTTSMGGNAELHNFGDLTLNGLNMNGSHNKVFNHDGAIMIVNSNVNIPNNGSFTNDGELIIQNDLSHNGTYNNNGKTSVGGNYNPSGVSNNNGTLNISGIANIGGNADIKNYCIMTVGNGINTSTNKFRNEGFIWVLNGSFQNSATFFQTSGAQLRGRNFSNSANINGAGKYYFSHNTANSGWFGQDGGGINFYDASRSNQALFFDQQGVAPHASVTKNIFTPADTTTWGGGSANAGADQSICTTQTTLNATGNGGTWSLISGTATIAENNNPNTLVTGLGIGNNVLRWTMPATCGVAMDEVSITRNGESVETTWVGTENNNWHNNNNWTHCVPGTSTKAIIRNAANTPVILPNQSGVAKKVELLSGGNLEISSGASLMVNEE